MKIIDKSGEMKVSELYAMTRAADIRKMESVAGSTLSVDAWVLFEDESTDKQTGEIKNVQVLAVRDGEEVFATISPTFKTEFFAIRDMCADLGEDFDHIEVCTRSSRNGRHFLTAGF